MIGDPLPPLDCLGDCNVSFKVLLSCFILLLAPGVFSAQEQEQAGPPSAEDPSVPNTQGDVVRILDILNQQIMTLSETVARLENEVSAYKIGNAGIVSELAEADRLAAELQQKKEFYRFIEIIVVAVLGIVALYVILWYLRKSDDAKRNHNLNHGGLSPQDIMNVSGLSLIVFGTILVVIIADADQQLTASVGILGALAGYLFRGLHDGPSHEPPSPSNPPPPNKDPSS